MKNEAFKVKFVPRRSCFLYFPQLWLSKLNLVETNVSKVCLKMTYGVNKCCYFSASVQPYNSSVQEQYVGINATYARVLGITENEEVLITSCPNAASVRKMNVSLASLDDWAIMEMNVQRIQASLLDQLRVVCPGQPILVWVSRNFCFRLSVGAVIPNVPVGILETFTDLVFTDPKTDTTVETYPKPDNALSDQNSPTQMPELKTASENNSSHLHSNVEQETNKFDIWGIFKRKLLTSPTRDFEDQVKKDDNPSAIPCTIERAAPLVLDPYRVHPLGLENIDPVNDADWLLKQPFNIFIHKTNLPPGWRNGNSIFDVTLCRITVIAKGGLTEHNERVKDENLKQKQNSRDENGSAKQSLPSAIFARLIIVEDMYKELSEETRNLFKYLISPGAFKYLLISASMRKTFKIDIGARIAVTMEPYVRKEGYTIEIISIGSSNADTKTSLIAHLSNLVKKSTLLLNTNTAIHIPKNETSGPLSVLIRICPPEREYIVLDPNLVKQTNFVVSDKKITLAENTDTAVIAPVINNPKTCSSTTRSLLNEGLATVEMDLNLLPSIHTFNKPFIPSNILIVGQPGCGKTTLARQLCDKAMQPPHHVHCVEVQCTQLKGKMVETLQKKLDKWIDDCVYHQPSILFLDDVDAILGITAAEEEGSQQEIHSLRVCEMLTEAIHEVQRSNYLLVIATAPSLSKLTASVASPRGQHFFKVILQIPEFSKDDRRDIIKELLVEKTSMEPEHINTIDLESHASKTEGYVVQDLVDMIDKATFEAWKRKLANGSSEINVEDGDITEAISATVPLSLQGVTLFKDATHTWADVGGLAEVKSILIEVLQWPSQYMDLYASCPLRLQTGLLLFGAPGTGKTLLAAAVAHECGLNFISVKGPELLSKYIGASEEGVRNIFQKAQSARPCVLFFDEFDSLAPRRGHDSTGVTDRVVNQLLTQLDGVEALLGVWVVAATSRPDLLDPALLRPGRLDKAVLCRMPDASDRLEILAAQSRRMKLAPDVQLQVAAQAAEGFTGADLQAVLYTAQVAALEDAAQTSPEAMAKDSSEVLIEVTQSHLMKALSETRPSLPLEEKMRYQRIYDKFVGARSGKRQDVEVLEQRITLA